jgi:hypothetical protein
MNATASAGFIGGGAARDASAIKAKKQLKRERRIISASQICLVACSLKLPLDCRIGTLHRAEIVERSFVGSVGEVHLP